MTRPQAVASFEDVLWGAHGTTNVRVTQQRYRGAADGAGPDRKSAIDLIGWLPAFLPERVESTGGR